MFPKTALTFLVVGALSVNALTVLVARSPAPEPDCEFPPSFPITSYSDLTIVPSTAQEPEAWMLKRNLPYDLFSREPEDWAQLEKRGNSLVKVPIPGQRYPHYVDPRKVVKVPALPPPAPYPKGK